MVDKGDPLELQTNGTGFADLADLEEKVERVAGQLQELRDENKLLEEEIERLREALAVRDRNLEEIRRDLEQANRERRDFAKEDAIRSKLTTLLAKIEDVEGLSIQQ